MQSQNECTQTLTERSESVSTMLDVILHEVERVVIMVISGSALDPDDAAQSLKLDT